MAQPLADPEGSQQIAGGNIGVRRFGASNRSYMYTGRFAPSPTGPLHLGSLCTALASWLDARAHGGRWLLRIEDIDTDRCRPEHAMAIIDCLRAHGLHHDGPISWQSKLKARYQAALTQLRESQRVYRCACSRRQIEALMHPARQAERPYPGTCRTLMRTEGEGAWRLIVPNEPIKFFDLALGPQQSILTESIGDFVVVRADGQSSYHLAVVVDDEWDGITDVVRGDDLLTSTARQIALQQRLAYRTLQYCHIPVMKDAHGQKLSKQQGAEPLCSNRALENLSLAARHLGLGELPAGSLESLLTAAISAWAARWIRDEVSAENLEPDRDTRC